MKCECGEWSGEACQFDGQAQDMVRVQFMAEYLRASHIAAGNRGRYPYNGSSQIRVSRECAALMMETDGDWCAEVKE